MDWQAKWIWAKSHSRTPKFYMYARKEFSVKSSSSATVHVTCSSEYKLYVNGRYVGRGPCPCLPQYQYYDSYDLKRSIRPGGNVIGVLCHNHGAEAPGGLLVQAEIACRGGEQLTIVTDETWSVIPAPEWDSDPSKISSEFHFREVYDSRKKPVGWNVVGFDDTHWEKPEVLGEVGIEPWRELIPQEIPHLREWEVFAEVNRRPDTCVVLDFGSKMVGCPTIRIADGGHGIVDISYGDYADRLILHGGRQEWQTFGRREFRYVQLSFVNIKQPILLESVSVQCIGYPVEQVSSFECSDVLLNDIWRAGVRELSISMQDRYTGDMRAGALTNYYCFNDKALVAKDLRQFVREWSEDSPTDCNPTWVLTLHDYYLHTGDRELVEQLYPHV